MLKTGQLKLKERRTHSGLTQEALARRAGFSLGYIARLEAGHHDPPVSTLVKLARALNIRPADLLR